MSNQQTITAPEPVSKAKQEATVITERQLTRPRRGFYYVKELFEITDERELLWDPETKQIKDSDGALLGHVQFAGTILDNIKYTPDLHMYDTYGELIAVIERSIGREVTIKLPGYDLIDDLVLKQLGRSQKKMRGWQLTTHAKDPNHWSSMIDTKFAKADKECITIDGRTVASFTDNKLVMDDCINDEKERATVFAHALNLWMQ
ncbi:hypothetical protein DICA3_E14950 [Diutina catenulata]